jgi:hypothetical protein
MGRSVVSTSVVKWSGVKVLVTEWLPLLEDIYIYIYIYASLIWLFRLSDFLIFFWFHCFYPCMYGCMFCMHLFNFVNCIFLLYVYVFLLLCMFWVFCFIVLLCVLYVCKCVQYYGYRVSTQLQLTKYIIYLIIQVTGTY